MLISGKRKTRPAFCAAAELYFTAIEGRSRVGDVSIRNISAGFSQSIDPSRSKEKLDEHGVHVMMVYGLMP